MVIVGALVTLFSLGPLFGGGFLIWADSTQKDSDGFFTSPDGRLETTAYAITSDDIDLGADPTLDDISVDLGDIVTLRLEVEGTDDAAVFAGIGRRDDVEDYLRGVGRATIDDLSFDPFAVSYRYSRGSEPSTPPGTQDFWVATAEGPGRQTLEWEPESGNWSVVVMNAAGERGVSVDAAVAAKSPWVFRVGVALLIGGIVGLLVGATLLVVGIVGLARRSHLDLPPSGAGPPVTVNATLDPEVNRGLWLVKWILLIPHLIILVVLWAAFAVVTIIAFFAILFTTRYPRSLFEFNVGVLRWTWRVSYYGYGALGTDRYPPFTLGEAPDYPATLSISYPEQLSRGLVLVKWWLLAIPHYLVLALIGGAMGFWGGWGDDGQVPFGGLLPLLVGIAAITLLFVGRYPRGLFDFIMGLNRWVYRVVVYAALMSDEYPPFRLDQGGEDTPRAIEAGPAIDVGASG